MNSNFLLGIYGLFLARASFAAMREPLEDDFELFVADLPNMSQTSFLFSSVWPFGSTVASDRCAYERVGGKSMQIFYLAIEFDFDQTGASRCWEPTCSKLIF